MGISLPVIGVPGVLGGGGGLPGPDTVANLAHWYNLDSLTRLFQDSAKTTPVAADGDPVGAWVDQIVAADEVAQATAGAKPTYRASVAALNNQPALQFDGGDRLFGAFTAASSQPRTVFLVAHLTTTGTIDVLMDGDDTTNRMIFDKDVAVKWDMFAGANVTDGAADTSPHIFAGVFNGASSVFYVDGGAGTAGNAGTQAPDGLSVGGAATNLNLITGFIADRIEYTGVLSTASKNVVLNYLASKYGISVTDFM